MTIPFGPHSTSPLTLYPTILLLPGPPNALLVLEAQHTQVDQRLDKSGKKALVKKTAHAVVSKVKLVDSLDLGDAFIREGEVKLFPVPLRHPDFVVRVSSTAVGIVPIVVLYEPKLQADGRKRKVRLVGEPLRNLIDGFKQAANRVGKFLAFPANVNSRKAAGANHFDIHFLEELSAPNQASPKQGEKLFRLVAIRAAGVEGHASESFLALNQLLPIRVGPG